MTDRFSFSRLGRLLATDFATNGKKYVMWLGLIFGFIAALTVFVIIDRLDAITDHKRIAYIFKYDSIDNLDPIVGFLHPFFSFALLLTCILAASLSMNNLSEKTSRINALMLPATTLEKFLSRWLIFVPIYLLVYLIGFQVLEYIRVGIEMMVFGSGANIETFNISAYLFSDNNYKELLWCLIIIQSLFVLGSTIWPKNSVVKTVCVLVIIGIAYVMMNILCAREFLPYEPYALTLTDVEGEVVLWIMCGIIALVNYTIAYYRYKEIEIIQRW